MNRKYIDFPNAAKKINFFMKGHLINNITKHPRKSIRPRLMKILLLPTSTTTSTSKFKRSSYVDKHSSKASV